MRTVAAAVAVAVATTVITAADGYGPQLTWPAGRRKP